MPRRDLPAAMGLPVLVGLRSGSMALITQSVDSCNHVIIAASVMTGLVTLVLRFSLLDTLVGLAVALLIFKSAVELAIETVRSLGEEVDLSHYKLSKHMFYRTGRAVASLNRMNTSQ